MDLSIGFVPCVCPKRVCDWRERGIYHMDFIDFIDFIDCRKHVDCTERIDYIERI